MYSGASWKASVALFSLLLQVGIGLLAIFGWTAAGDCIDPGWHMVAARTANSIVCLALEALAIINLVEGWKI